MPKERKKSNEEEMFEHWADEALNADIISEWKEQPVTFEILPKQTITVEKQLKTKTKTVNSHLCHPHTYTPDFMIKPTEKGKNLLAPVFDLAFKTEHFQKEGILYIDTKGAYTVQQGQKQVFSCNQKLCYRFYRLWVEKVIPWAPQKKKKKSCLFIDTWCPEEYRWKKNRKKPTLTVKGELCISIEKFCDKT